LSENVVRQVHESSEALHIPSTGWYVLELEKEGGTPDASWGPYAEKEFADRVKQYLDEENFEEAKAYDEVYEENREEIQKFLEAAKASGLIKPTP